MSEKEGRDQPASPGSTPIWDRLADVPDMNDAPLEADWLPAEPGATPGAVMPPAAESPGAAQPARDQRQFRVTAAPGATSPPVSRPPQPGPPLPSEAPPAHPEDPPEWDTAHTSARRGRRSRRGWWLAVVLLLPATAILGTALYSWYLWGQVEKVDTEGALSPGSGFTNYLIVGVDSREGVDPALGPQVGLNAGANLSDTMLVLHVDDGDNNLVSLPRDLWVSIDGGAGAKLNASTAIGGAPALIRTVDTVLDIPVHRYLEVDIAGFIDVIEAVGSITIVLDAPACDPKSGLDVRETGAVALEPPQALAYVRSRTYTTFDAAAATGLDCKQIRAQGLGSTVGVSDFGRTERQRHFLNAVFDELSGTRNPVTLLQVLSGLTGGLRVDDEMSVFDAFQLFRDLQGLNAEPLAVPVSDFSAPDGSSALQLNDRSDEVLDLLRG